MIRFIIFAPFINERSSMYYFYKVLVICSLFLFFANTPANAQEKRVVEYYQNLLNNENDSVRMLAKKALSWELRDSNPLLAIKYGDEALKMAKKQSWLYQIAELENFLGVYHRNIGNYNQASDYFFSALRVYGDSVRSFPYGAALNNVGNMYYRLGFYKEAYQYTKSAYELFHFLHSEIGVAYTYNQFGLIYTEIDSLEKALSYHQLALEIRQKLGNKNGIGTSYLNMAQLFLRNKNTKDAFKYIVLSKRIFTKISSKSGIASCNKVLGDIQLLKNNPQKACFFYRTASKQAREINDISLESTILLKQIKISENQKNISDYFKYTSRYNLLVDSLANVRIGFHIAQLTKDLENEKSLNALSDKTNNALIKKEQKLKEQAETINLFNAYLGVFSILFLAIILYSFVLRRTNKKLEYQRNEIVDKNDEMRQQAEEIKSQSEMLLKANEELEKLSIVARETDNAVIITNSDLEITWANESFSRFYGFTLAEFKQNIGSKLFEVSGNEQILEYVKEAELKHDSVVYSNQYHQKNGSTIWTQTVLTPVFDSVTDKLDRLIAIDSDITELKKAKDFIEIQNKEITSSISYASKLQKALLPLPIYADALLNDHIVLYYPKDIVSGDFYWMTKKAQKNIVAVADCTGHGIPGAFMTALSLTLLRNTIDRDNSLSPDKVLFALRNNLIKTLHQRNLSGSLKDGFDIALVYYNPDTLVLEYAGGNIPILVIRNSDQYYFKPDKMPIGVYDRDQENFSLKTFQLQKGDMLYMFTDGFIDQFGGEFGKKYYRRRLNNFLQTIASKEIAQQKRLLAKEFIVWKGDNAQVDDVLLLGFRV